MFGDVRVDCELLVVNRRCELDHEALEGVSIELNDEGLQLLERQPALNAVVFEVDHDS